ncbi:hypothetical protein [Kluyvera genomosp. 3]|uniref:Morphogenetic protein n=1 Tax=Kluyvera genomosp. 3 TaxID=2774055 RepID=A0A6G9RKR0_9ENTR|nr:hypothetical protein [Kluyvera genomosp. 3]QIR27544.1 hypothetical protein GY169_12350 [Kluyvera genomosp. 3]
MKERPILFKGGLVRAILDGRKTQTRRIIKPQPVMYEPGQSIHFSDMINDALRCPLGQPGDRIWVRETWQAIHEELNDDGYVDETTYAPSIPKEEDNYWHPVFAADNWCEDINQRGFPWRPAIHMPRWASRILLEITEVRVEHLQSISDRDVLREGLCQLPASGRYCLQPGAQYFGMASHSAQEAYSWLWSSIYGEASWKANPWVWVIEFKRIEDDAK